MTNEELVEIAVEAMHSAYAPYSRFHVGAALLANDGTIVRGCNIENASFGATNCAERTAIFKAVSEGIRGFERIAIVGGIDCRMDDYAAPCGICRQVMGEFCRGDFRIILAKDSTDGKRDIREYTLDQLMPERFTLVE